MKIISWIILIVVMAAVCAGCAGPRITLFSDAADPLREMTLEGTADDKIQVIPITGLITDEPKGRVMRTTPSMVQEVVSHLRLAEKDDHVKVVLFKINTPGGTTTASDILYHEIAAFKARTGKKVVVCMMNIATSGGYDNLHQPGDTPETLDPELLARITRLATATVWAIVRGDYDPDPRQPPPED